MRCDGLCRGEARPRAGGAAVAAVLQGHVERVRRRRRLGRQRRAGDRLWYPGASMKVDIHPEYVVSRHLLVWQRVHDPLDEGRAPRRGVLRMPSVLHGQAEAHGLRRPGGALPAPPREGRGGRRLAAAASVVVGPLTDERRRHRDRDSGRLQGSAVAAGVASGATPLLRDRATRARYGGDVSVSYGGQAVLEGVMMRGRRAGPSRCGRRRAASRRSSATSRRR